MEPLITFKEIKEGWHIQALDALKRGEIVSFNFKPDDLIRKNKYVEYCRKAVGKNVWICYPVYREKWQRV